MRIEKVFQIPRASGNYENIKIAEEGDTIEECLKKIYHALYMDRIVSIGLGLSEGDPEAIYAFINKVDTILENMHAPF